MMFVSQAVASDYEFWKKVNPDQMMTRELQEWGIKTLDQTVPDYEKMKQGALEIDLPKVDNIYNITVQIGYKSTPSYVGQGGTNVKDTFPANKPTHLVIALTFPGYGIIDERHYILNADNTITTKGFDQLNKPMYAESELVNRIAKNPNVDPLDFSRFLQELEEIRANGGNVLEALENYEKQLQEKDPNQKRTFTDIDTHWAKGEIENGVELGFIKGYPDLTFQPNNNITRAEFTTALLKAVHVPTSTQPSVFIDDNNWAEPFIQGAIEKGIIVPSEYSNDRFEPNKKITRQEIAVMVVRALDMEKKAQNQTILSKVLNNFTDMTSIDEKFRGYITIAKDLGIIRGYLDGSFGPHKNATRAEAVVMILNAVKNIED